MEQTRKFEYVERYNWKGPEELPQRSTAKSAGYDFFCMEGVTIPPYKIGDAPVLIKTGIKAQFPDDEVLLIFNRSSNPKKKHLVIPNGVGVVDADYYNNPDNEGEIGFLFWNMSNEDITIGALEKLGQGIFVKYGTVIGDNATGERAGGFGSTGK